MQTAHIQAVHLTWTVPTDPGGVGLGSYDVRYSTTSIDDSNWASASQASGEPVPGTPGATERFTVTGLQPNTLYYFAVKTADASAPPNESALSNVASGTTLPPIAPVTVHNPWLVSDRVADTHNINTMAATYVNAYTPSGVVPATSDEGKAINIYDNQKRRLYHWADEPPTTGGDINDPTYNQNVFGWCLCGRHASQACTIIKAAGLGQRKIGLPGHWIYEVQYGDGSWHAYDTMTTMYVYNKVSTRKVANCAEMKVDSTLLANAVADGRACPGFLLCGDTTDWYQSAVGSWSDYGDGSATPTWNGQFDLRPGQTFKRTWESWLNQHPVIGGGGTPPYHHEARRDNQDYVNFPYWEPYALTTAQSTAVNVSYTPTYRRWSNGTDTLAPDFRSAAYQAMLFSSTGIATYNNDSLSPDLHVATVGTTAEAVFQINIPYYITDANFSGDFVKTNSGDVCNVQFSTNGTSWTTVWTASALGTTHVANQPLRSNVFGRYQTWYIKVQMKGTVAKSDAGVSNFVVVTTFEHNKGAMAYLDKGVNHITLTFDNAAELQASHNVMHVVYKWKEFNGSDWTVDKQFETYTSSSPAAFTINTAGSKVPRTEYILLEVTPPPFDPIPPAGIFDLASGSVWPTKIALTWTATGDDGVTGTATAYDLRYSLTPIVDDATFNAATQAVGTPSPRSPGIPESFIVTGLTPSTTYYFAIKAIDEVGNRSVMSNVMAPVSTTPPDTILPNTIANLGGTAGSTAGNVNLTWTAPADYGYGGVGPYTCVSYDLRYSTSPIDDTNWATATKLVTVPAPKAPGTAESFTASGLANRTTYYFAIKSADEAGNISLLSNVATVRTTGPLTLTPVADSGLYGAGSDYSNRGTGGRFDIGTTQDALIKFDLAGKLAPGEMITGATLQLYTARSGYNYNLHILGYPLAAPWQEGIGNAGTVGDLGFPWAPASIGDAVFAFQQTTAVGPGTGSFAGKTVATAGIPWNTPGGRGIGTDVLDRPLFVLDWTKVIGPNDPAGMALPAIPLTADGAAVLRGWSSGTVANNGLNIWASSGSGYAALTSREFAGNRPQLILAIGLAGDASGDGHVDVTDLLAVAAAWGKNLGDVGYDSLCDFNGNGSVNVIDLLMLADNWGQ